MRELRINLDAIAANLNTMRSVAPTAKICGVVKANAYGHGMVQVAKRLVAEGIDYLGVADVPEALQLRAAGINVPVLAWLHDFDEDFVSAVTKHIDVGISSLAQLRAVIAAAEQTGQTAAIHVKVDTGLSRNGVMPGELAALLPELTAAVASGSVHLTGVFSHLSCTSRQDDLAQIANFEAALAEFEAAGLKPTLRHLTASDGTLSYPQAHYDMVRVGVALYGLSPYSDHSSADYGLTPAMTACAKVVLVKRVPAATGVSYGYLYSTPNDTNLALIPVGYAEGLPRLATGGAKVWINGVTYPVLARIAMDQLVIDVGDNPVVPGDAAVLFGDPALGYPSADSLAEAAQTINYEIVTRMGGRFKRVYEPAGAQSSEQSGAQA